MARVWVGPLPDNAPDAGCTGVDVGEGRGEAQRYPDESPSATSTGAGLQTPLVRSEIPVAPRPSGVTGPTTQACYAGTPRGGQR